MPAGKLGAAADGGLGRASWQEPRPLTRRRLLALAAVTVGAALVSGVSRAPQRRRGGSGPAAAPAPPLAPRPPSVLLITIDTLRADQVGAYGHPYIQTPALDGVARQGALFAAHVIQEPQTNPAHASMFTGMYPASNGVRIHMVDLLPEGLDTLATAFKRAGYSTAGLYSYSSFQPQYCNLQRGFDVYRDLTENRPDLSSSRIGIKGRADVTTEAAIDQLRAFRSDCFFMWLHYFDPHYPYEPPPDYVARYDPAYDGSVDGSMATIDAIESQGFVPVGADLRHLLAVYQAAVTYTDHHLASLLAELDRLGRAGGTILAITGDHGEAFGEHHWLTEGSGFFHPHSLYDAEARIPLLLRYPDRLRSGVAVDLPTQGIDLLPTLLTLAGLPVPDQAQGRSLRPRLDGEPVTAEPAAYSAMPDYTFTSVSVPGWKLVQNNAGGDRALFDKQADPLEQRDAGAARPDVKARLAAKLDSWMRQVGVPLG